MTYGTYQATHYDLALHSGEKISIYFPFSTSFIPLLLLAAIHFFISVIYFCSKITKTDHVLMWSFQYKPFMIFPNFFNLQALSQLLKLLQSSNILFI
jgi:hypothetical protein